MPGRGAVALLALTAGVLALAACKPRAPLDFSGPVSDWPEYGRDKGGLRFSPLTQVTPANVGDLRVAWVYHHGDISDGSDGTSRTSFNATPIVVDDALYFCTGLNRVIALEPETGRELWTFDPKTKLRKLEGPYPRTCRGVAYWPGKKPGDTRACSSRVFTGTIDSELIALDARSGEPCADFGVNGRVALREGLGDAPPWEYYVTSPPLVIGDRVVVGALVSDNLRTDAPSGVVRAFDAVTGKLSWAFDPVPPGALAAAAAPGAARYRPGTANVWSILSADAERGLVYVPTGNAAPDYWAATRNGLDAYSSSVIALRAETGEIAWQFQTVHHDVWDYDVPAQPILFDLRTARGPVAALAQVTKMGHVFVLDRTTGEPLFPVEERTAPQTDVPGESLSPTQPFPTHPRPIHPTRLAPEDAWGFTRWDRAACANQIRELRSDGIFTPPSLRGSIEFPGPAGGPNWGGAVIDPVSQVMYVNEMRVPSVVQLIPRDEYERIKDSGKWTYPNELYPMKGTPYAVRRGPLLSPLGAPCNSPPWGTITKIDLQSGETLWESVLGTTRDQAPFPIWLHLGAPNLGGALATAGGLVFIGATTDKFFRAFDAKTGREIWTERLPYTANATPITYRLRADGRQFIVVAAGGHGWSQPGDALMAFALP
ncbi:MAG: pyrroloquinoline quinone-dependent dehydrogenase [Myxococcota bacterium]